MTDSPERGAEVEPLPEDHRLIQSQKIDAFIDKVYHYANRRAALPLQQLAADARSSLDSHTAAETILLSTHDLQETEARKVFREVFGHEANNFRMFARHALYLSSDPPVPEDQWGIVDSQDRAAFEAHLAKSWELREERTAAIVDGLHHPYDRNYTPPDLDAVFDDQIKSAYVGLFIGSSGLYPYHSIDLHTLKQVILGFRNVMDIFTVPPEQRAALLDTIEAGTVTVGDFINIFPDKHQYMVSGNLDHRLNQFDMSLVFEILQNAKKYRVDSSEQVEVFIDDQGQIEVKNRSKCKVDPAVAELGERQVNSNGKRGNGFGVVRLREIADINNEIVEYSNTKLGDGEESLYAVTCTLRKAA